ncbi:glycosyltransferase [Alicyclobacillus tolerans]|uniref:glycosyltransferase n=1 Tax=Alicyclobacillus tolerans TaxID=90970 RepID=UPI003B7F2A20
MNKINVLWEGPQFVNSSLALVNRNLCEQILKHQHFNLRIKPTTTDVLPDSWVTDAARLKDAYKTILEKTDVHIRQQWPPLFDNMEGSHFVMFQPWEFGTIPVQWVKPINDYVDEVWVNSEYTKTGYVRSGIPSDNVFVFPLGHDPNIYRTFGPKIGLKTKKKFKFLFVGGTIFRKGIDILLTSYTKTFSAEDDVCLVIKDHGGNSHYQGQTNGKLIESIQQQPGSPEILYLDHDMTPYEMASLYRSCNCLVHPYRGEGFGLPILEAMACGLAPIIPSIGPAVEFTTPEVSYRVDAVTLQETALALHTVSDPEMISVDISILAKTMKNVFLNPDEARQKGLAASRYAFENYTWDKTAERMLQRITEISAKKSKPKPTASIEQICKRVAHTFEGEPTIREQLYYPLVKFFNKGDFVVDLGAGDGTWLTLLKQSGISGVGVDTDIMKVEVMRAKGIEAVCADAFDYISTLKSQIDGLSMLHIIEHMQPDQAIRILYEVTKCFTYKGRVLIVTPNFQNDTVIKKNFWLDITHVRPYPYELLSAILNSLGFKTILQATMNNELDTVVFGSMLSGDNPFVS